MPGDIRTIPLWTRAPFIRILPPFVLGIITAYYIDFSYGKIVISAFVLLILIVFYGRLRESMRFRFRYLTGFLFILLLFLSGVFVVKINDITARKNWYGNHLDEATALRVVLISKPQEKAKTFKITGKIISVFAKNEISGTRGSILLYISKDSAVMHLRAGDELVVKNTLRKIGNSGGPGSFDYKKYLSFQEIYHQGFLREGDWAFTGRNSATVLSVATEKAFNYSQQTIEQEMKGLQEIALAKALLTGDRSALDRDLVQAYANTGVVHIMAISGLHIGLIYLFLLKFLDLIPILGNNDRLKFFLVLAGIWFFAFMTGLSPSVMRASIMFSFLTLGLLKKYNISTLNFWAAAAFFILCFKPLLIFHVGFELSFTAVLGILVAQKSIYRWFYFENKVVDYLWQLISITISAQLFTLPLVIFYFHQFPVLFIVANVFAIPLASVGLWLGLLLLIFSWVPVLSEVLGIGTDLFFKSLNWIITYISGSSFSILNGFYPIRFQAILLMVFISAVLYWLLFKNKSALKLSLLIFSGLMAIQTLLLWNANRQNKAIFYNFPYTTAIDFISGNRYTSYYYSSRNSAGQNTEDIQVSREIFRAKKRGAVLHYYKLGGNELYFGKKSFLHVKHREDFIFGNKIPAVEVVILSNSADVTLSELEKSVRPDLFIFTPSNRSYSIDNWKKECEALGLNCYDINEDGALVLNY